MTEDNTTLTPEEGRLVYRFGRDFKSSTFGKFGGFLQTNVSIIPSDFSSDYELFCKLNSAACPLLSKSSPGQLDCPFAINSDIRTDLAAYQTYIDGKPSCDAEVDLLNYPWGNMVTFHLGCSFSFDAKLAEGGVQLDTSRDCPLLLTNIKCLPAGRLTGNMIVSIRPIPQHLLEKVVNLTLNLDFAHGAPIHVGDPSEIGVLIDETGLIRGDYCGDISIKEDEVPCFWACGYSSVIAAINAKIPICFSQYLNSLFPTDIPLYDAERMFNSPQYPSATVFCIDKVKQRYTLVSKNTYHTLSKLSETVSVEEDLHLPRICLEITTRSKSVGIFIGSKCDNLDGVIHIARALQSIGAEVTILCTTCKEILKEFLCACRIQGLLHENVALYDVSLNENIADISHLISITPESFSKLGTITEIKLSENNKLVNDNTTFRCLSITAGCFAIAAGLYFARKCAVHDRYVRNGLGTPKVYCNSDFAMSPESEQKMYSLLGEKRFPVKECSSVNRSVRMVLELEE